MPDMSSQIAGAIGRIPSGCAILTARHNSARTGMLASWIQQAAFEPPIVSVAVKSGRPIESIVRDAGGFVLNLLGENPVAMFKHFGKGFAPGEEAFQGLAVDDVPFGVAIPDRIARLSCMLKAEHFVGDHTVFFGEVIDAESEGPVKPPYVHVRKSGANY